MPAEASEQYDRMNLVVLGLAVLITWSPAWSAVGLRDHDGGVRHRSLPTWTEPATTEFAHHIVRLVVDQHRDHRRDGIQERRRWRDVVNVHALEKARVESRETQARYQLLIDTAGSAIVVLSPEHRILEFNREAEAIYGWSRAEVLGKDYLRAVPSRRATAEVVAGLIQRILDGAIVKGSRARSTRGAASSESCCGTSGH